MLSYGLVISYMYTHPGTEVSHIQSQPLENMICLTATCSTPFFTFLTITLFYIVEFIGGWQACRKF